MNSFEEAHAKRGICLLENYAGTLKTRRSSRFSRQGLVIHEVLGMRGPRLRSACSLLRGRGKQASAKEKCGGYTAQMPSILSVLRPFFPNHCSNHGSGFSAAGPNCPPRAPATGARFQSRTARPFRSACGLPCGPRVQLRNFEGADRRLRGL